MKIERALGLTSAFVLSLSAVYAQDVRVTVDGERVHFGDRPAMQDGSHVLVPLRGVFEKMGATVDWHPDEQTVVATRGNHRIRIKIGESHAKIDGNDVPMDQPAKVMGGTTMVPLRFISESLGASVDWDQDHRTVRIDTTGHPHRQDDDHRGHRGDTGGGHGG